MSSLLSRIQTSLSALLPQSKPASPTVQCYGQQECGMDMETIEQVMQWVFGTMFHSGYFGQAHLFWLYLPSTPELTRYLQKLHRKGEPILGYRCNDRTPEPPNGYYWRLMSEHPSLRIYQLEVKQTS